MAILLVSPFKETWGLKGLALWPRPALTLGVCHPGWEMGMGPRWDTGAKQGPASPLLVSWGVASTTCHPSKPDGKSGLFIQQSFHTWKFLDGHGRWAGSEQPAQGLPLCPLKVQVMVTIPWQEWATQAQPQPHQTESWFRCSRGFMFSSK